MQDATTTILYAADVLASAAFYERLLGRKPLDASPGFAMFALNDGAMLGLWRRADVLPSATATAGASELCWSVADRASVDARHAVWYDQGVKIAQAPTAMDFGYTFTALDPDGHRLRVFVPEGA
ncbi:MAG: VOC family protein [Burkholderiales bacterium]|nr:VOC family protein [Burkholderiales bacterium]